MELNKKELMVYKLLSVIGYALLFQRLFVFAIYKRKDMELYVCLCVKMLMLLIIYILFPGFVLNYISDRIYNNVFNILILLYIYIMGYIITKKLYKYWLKKIK